MKHGGGLIMLCSCIVWSSTGPVESVQGTLKSLNPDLKSTGHLERAELCSLQTWDLSGAVCLRRASQTALAGEEVSMRAVKIALKVVQQNIRSRVQPFFVQAIFIVVLFKIFHLLKMEYQKKSVIFLFISFYFSIYFLVPLSDLLFQWKLWFPLFSWNGSNKLVLFYCALWDLNRLGVVQRFDVDSSSSITKRVLL